MTRSAVPRRAYFRAGINLIFLEYLYEHKKSFWSRFAHLLTGYNSRQLAYGTGGPSNAEQFYTEAMLRNDFGALDLLELVDADVTLNADPAYQGLSSVIGMAAKKP